MKDNSKLGSSDSLIAAVRSIMEKEHTVPKGAKEKKLAALAHPKDKITHKDVLVGRGVLKKENSGERMGTIVATRKEKVELDPKLKEEENADDDFASTSRGTTRGRVVKTKSGTYIATNQSGSTKSFNDKAKADKHASSGLKKEEVENVDERKLTGAETDKKEKYVMSLKKKMGGFKKRYGERAKEVMYATATKMAKNEETGQIDEIDNAPSSGDYSRYNSPEAQERRKKEREELAKQAHSTPKKAKIASKLGIKKEEVEQVQEISTGLASRYLKKTDPETSSPKEVEKRKTGRALALTKKWGGRVSGTSAPKVPTKD